MFHAFHLRPKPDIGRPRPIDARSDADASARTFAPMPFFTHSGITMAVERYGNGAIPVLAFHGFGRTGSDFATLATTMGDRYTLHAFDLPFHGKSPGPTERVDLPYGAEELGAFFTAYVEQLGTGRAGLLGYSFGGRIALTLLEQVPERWSAAWLVAPDGLTRRPWYRGMAHTVVGRSFYSLFIDRPGIVHGLIHLLYRMRLIGELFHRFLINHSDSRTKRQLLHDIWLSYRMLEPDLRKVAANIQTNAIPTKLVFGRYDQVIKPVLGEQLVSFAPENITANMMDGGHSLLSPALGEWLAKQPVRS